MNRLPLILILLTFLCTAFKVKASHTTAADISYRVVDDATNRYEITLKVYMKCADVANPGGCTSYKDCGALVSTCNAPGPSIVFLRNSCGDCIQLTFTDADATITEANPYCPSVETNCGSGTRQGFQEWVYKREVTLDPCADWEIAFNNYARSADITNIVNPGANGTTVVATLDNSTENNNSVSFSNQPLPFACIGGQFCFNNGAVEPDGDSLSFEFVSPINEVQANIRYVAPYSFNNPMSSSTPITCDPITGDICLTPDALETTVIAVKVTEYRNGVEIGSTVRDIQIAVRDCSREPGIPDIPGSTTNTQDPITNLYEVDACAGLPVILDIPFKSDGVKDDGSPVNLTITTKEFLDPDPTIFSVASNGTPNPVLNLEWTPGPDAPNNNPHTFQVTIKDDGCPITTVNTVTFKIFVDSCDIMAEITDSVTLCPGESIPIEVFNVTGGIPPIKYEWAGQDPSLNGPGPHIVDQAGTYTCRVYDEFGNKDTTVSFALDFYDSPIITISGNTEICQGDATVLTASGANTYTWSPTTNVSDPNSPSPTFTPTVTTAYTVTGTDINGCQEEEEVIITVEPNPIPQVTVADICEGETVNFSVNASGADRFDWLPNPGISSIGNGATATSQSDTSFNYTVTAISEAGCTGSFEGRAIVNPLPDVDAGPDLTMCEGIPVTLNVTGAEDYEWIPNDGSLNNPTSESPEANPSATTTYTVIGTDVNGCSFSDQIRVTVFPKEFANAGQDITICKGETTLLRGLPNGGASYRWEPATLVNDPNNQNPVFNGISVGPKIMTLTVTLDNGCVDDEQVTVNVLSNPNVIIQPDPAEVCFGENITLSASGANTYSWEPGVGGISGQNTANYTVSPNETTTYEVTGTDADGCVSKVAIEVTVNGIPDAPLEDAEICADSFAILDATTSGAISYLWTPSNGLDNDQSASPTATPLGTTNYEVEITDNNGCITNLPVTVIVNSLPSVNAGLDFEVCQNSPQLINASASGVGLRYNWNPQTYLNSSVALKPTINHPIAGNYIYSINVTDRNGCKANDNVQITVLPLPNVQVDNLQPGACSNDSVQVTASGAISYVWAPSTDIDDPNSASIFISSDDSRIYTVTGTDAKGCTNIVGVDYKAYPDAVAAHAPNVEACEFSTFTFQAQMEDNYLWRPSQLLDDSTIANPTTILSNNQVFTLITTTNDGCIDSTTVNVSVNPIPTADAGPDSTIICLNDQLIVGGNPTASSSRPMATFTYAWRPNSKVDDSSSSNPSVIADISEYYFVEITDDKNCSSIDSIFIKVNPLPNANAGSDMSICPENTAQLNASGAGSNGTYFWSPGASLSNASVANPIASPSSSTQYTVRVTDSNNCVAFDSVTVSIFPKAQADAGPDQEMCFGEVVNLNGSGGISYRWSPVNVLNDSTLQNPNAFPGIDTRFTLAIVDQNGCHDTAFTNVFVNQLPDIIFTQGDTLICEGSSVTLGASGGSSYLWSPAPPLDNPTKQNPIASISAPTTFTVQVTDNKGCQETNSMSVGFYPFIDPTPMNIPFICPEDTTIIVAVNGLNGYRWEPDYGIVTGKNNDTVIVSPDVTTSYTVYINDENTCERQNSTLLNVYPEAQASITVSAQSLTGLPVFNRRVVIVGETVQVQGYGGSSYRWQPEELFNNHSKQKPLFTPDSNVVISLSIIDENGCVDTTTYDIETIRKSFVYVPTAFTPNGDNENDVFKVIPRNDYKIKLIQIFNRWGNLIWSTNNIDDVWDGTMPNGEPAEIGVYAVYVEGYGNIEPEIVKQGTVTLIR